jgi:hypothetical protein
MSNSDLPSKEQDLSAAKELFLRRYTEEEITSIYELARLSFETADYKRSEIVCAGLIAVAPTFIPAFLLMAILRRRCLSLVFI